MDREKVKLEYITDDLKRKVSFRKRKENVIKKTSELNILCDVDAAAIIYSGRSDSRPQVWPDDQGVHRFLEKYHGRPVLEKTLNQEGLIQQRLLKEKQYLKKLSNENYEEELSQLMINYMGGYADPTMVSENALHLKMLVEQNLKEIDRVMEASGKEDEVYVPAPPMSEEGLLINGENENGQILHHHGMGSGNWNSPSCWNNMENSYGMCLNFVNLGVRLRGKMKMPPRRHTLRSVASDGESSDEASTQPADQHIRGRGRGRGQGVRGRGARVRGGRASQTTRESIPAETENRRPPRRSTLEAAVVGLQGVVEALTGLIAEQRAEDAP
ncbi:agamous-like MADS-box protein AGL80 [Senna tora]|uniref:Agamous-like MADS-box protein AGL80 n=1 Tax=Senna tora TaxID=362788 RepID=A0A834TMZ5_9FABA|nr:agamous-like MADS-box protein AGL80 [Senna tora]